MEAAELPAEPHPGVRVILPLDGIAEGEGQPRNQQNRRRCFHRWLPRRSYPVSIDHYTLAQDRNARRCLLRPE